MKTLDEVFMDYFFSLVDLGVELPIERMENRLDAEEALKSLEEFRASGEKGIPLSDVKQEFLIDKMISFIGDGVCRVCGCTDGRACPGGCYWVEPDLCSACYEQRNR